LDSEKTVPAELADRAALSLIAADLGFFSNLTFNPRLEPIRSVAFLALMPFLSAFVSESAAYVKQSDLDVDRELRSHEELLRTSRLRLKLLDDSRRSFDEILKNVVDLAAVSSGWFTDMHDGVLALLKTLIQPDLGVYFLEDDVFCTTHVAFLNVGLTEEALSASSLSLDTLGPYLYKTAIDRGYMGLLLLSLQIDLSTFDTAPDPLPSRVQYRDLKSEHFYRSMARMVAPGRSSICLLLMSVLSQVNTARLLVPMIAGHNEVAAFKIGFVSLFHAASSLQSLLDQDEANPFLYSDARHRISAAVHASPVQGIRDSRDLRNNLVHYRISKRAASRLSPQLPLFGLVEAHVAGKTLASLTRDVGLGLHHVAVGLRGLLPRTLTPKGML
jgi:hypothetical protein